MRITVAYNVKTKDTEEQAELLTQEEVDRIVATLKELKHTVTGVEVSNKPHVTVQRLLDSEPDLIFNVAEGTVGTAREAFFPGLYEQLGIPFTGGDSSLLHMNFDKHLSKTVVASHGIRVPQGVLLTRGKTDIPETLEYPLFIKPNAEGSSKGISQNSVVEDVEQAQTLIKKMLGKYPAGVIVEEFIQGRELSVPMLEAYHNLTLEIVEHTFDLQKTGGKYNIYDYESKLGDAVDAVSVHCPPKLGDKERRAVLKMAQNVFSAMNCPDLGRVDIRLREDGTPFFIELNPLPCLHSAASMMLAAHSRGLSYKDVLKLIVRSAAKRYGIPLRKAQQSHFVLGEKNAPRSTARELGIRVGFYEPGLNNAITDVKGVKVGHVTKIEHDVEIPGLPGKSEVRTGVTAIQPGGGDVFNRHIVSSGFVLNGIGEVSGLTQAIEWGWIETPILLTNTASVGTIQRGVVQYMLEKHPELQETPQVVIPVVGETDDSFLNDVRIPSIVGKDAARAIKSAKSGPVAQGSVGAGTGMTTLDFAGGIGTSSRVIPETEGGYTVGVLVLSNFGKMRNITIDGTTVGRSLDKMFPMETRRGISYGSVIVVVATDAPLLSNQLHRISKRAALGLGRAGSHARSTSGEIILAFSTANRVLREEKKQQRHLTMKFLSDQRINPIYEAVIEAVDEAVLNAMFCSPGMDGHNGHHCPGIPQDEVLELIHLKYRRS